MLRPRSGVQCVAHDGCLYVFGGNDGVMRQTSCEKFDPVTRTWTLLADMKTPRSNFAAVGLEGFIYIIGGFNGVTTINEVECYDPKANQWQEMWSMNLQRSALSACVYSSLPNAQEYTWLKRELRPVKGTAGATGRRSPRRRPSGRS
ncbi:Kelch-like protein 10 [Halotydeus destructor]|nr:Kelch-like protein 10 [Halotydeus destructor]